MRKNYFLLLIFSFFLLNVGVSQITSNSSGEWSTGATWVGGIAPTATDDVLIAAGHTISVSDINAVGKSISFGGDDALIDMNTGARLTVYGNFTLFSTAHTAFSAGWSGTDAILVFAGDADQTLSGWKTTGGSTSFRDVEINKTGGVVQTSGANMRLGIQNSLHIINGEFLLNDNDDIEARWASSGNYTSNQNLNITVEADGIFNMDQSGYHHVRSGTGLAIGTVTVHGFARFAYDSSNGIFLTAIDVEDGGTLQLSPGMADEYFHPGPITIKSGGEISLSTTADIWDDIALVDLQAGALFSTTASSTVFPTNFTENGTVLYHRSTTTQTIRDRDYTDLKIELANDGPKNWDIASTRTIGALTIENGGQLVLSTSGGALGITNDVYLESGTVLSIGSGVSITVGGDVVLDSDETKSSSLINEGIFISSSFTYKRYMDQDDWHLLGSPLVGQIINTSFLSTNNISGMKDYSESSDDWNTVDFTTTAPDLAFSLGQGYAIKNSTSGTVGLMGTLNSTSVSVPLTHTGNGWNLLSNPFTSAINATPVADATDNLLSANEGVLNPSRVALYIWDEASTSYKIVNKASDGTLVQDYLQVGQAFFVQSANPATGTFDMTPSMQNHMPDIAFKSTEVNSWASIVLNAVTTNSQASTQILFREDMSNGLDVGFDAGRFNDSSDLSLYSKLIADNGVDFGLQCLPTSTEDQIIPIGLNAKSGELIKITATVDVPESYDVVLEDRTENKFTSLTDTESEYLFQLSGDSDGYGRFYIHTSYKSTLGFGDIAKNDAFQVFSHVSNHQLIIHGEATNNTTAKIFSITGEQIKAVNLMNGNENSIQFDENAGIYIVQISSESGTVSKKFTWLK